jgi:NADPH:quinone reductase-like Zn-dependent oxidoreductase
LTGGRGVDHILEVGGVATLPVSMKALRDGGHLSVVGLLSGGRADPEAAGKNDRGIRVDSVYVGSARHLDAVAGAFARAHVRPVVDRVFPFDQAVAAYRSLEAGEHLGKIVIRI